MAEGGQRALQSCSDWGTVRSRWHKSSRVPAGLGGVGVPGEGDVGVQAVSQSSRCPDGATRSFLLTLHGCLRCQLTWSK